MKIEAICPISDQRIDENVARFNGFFTVVILSVFAITANVLPVLFLAVDFFLRGANLSKYSVLSFISKRITHALSLHKNLINAGPKIFAARIGFAFTIAILVSFVFDASFLAYSFAAIFGLCAFLEAAFALCIACEIYPYFYKIIYHSKFAQAKK